MRRALHRDGWYQDEQEGSHLALLHPEKPGRVTLPMHRGDLKLGTIRSILKQAGLSAEDLRRLL
jgi:predicted RNA binding protein YcfA (HicA-like mRNA interferase family)